MRGKITYLVSPLASIFLLILGMGFFTTFISVKLKSAGDSNFIIGTIHSAYYAGLFLGAFIVERLVRSVGHIRAFASTASITAIATILMGLFDYHLIWISMRFLTGLCMAVQYVAIESWLLMIGNVYNRGRILALYMIAFYISQAVSQFFIDLINISTSQAYMISSLFAAAAVVPVSLSMYGSPDVPDEPHDVTLRQVIKKSPIGFTGSVISGIILTCIYGFTPVFAVDYDLSVSWIMFTTIAGGIILQWPLGKISDQFDRRWVLLLLSITIFVPSILIWFYPYDLWLILLLSFILGGIAFTLYPVSSAEVCDHFDAKHLTAVTTVLLIAYGIGSIIGPLIGPLVTVRVGTLGFYLFYGVLGVLQFFFGLFMLHREKRVKRQQEFLALPNVTPVAYELDPRNIHK